MNMMDMAAMEEAIAKGMEEGDSCRIFGFDPNDISKVHPFVSDSKPVNKGFENFVAKMRAEKEKSMKTTSLITVGIVVAGAHHYPESTRSYLRGFHRHDFKISVNIGVIDHNRQYEFYDVQEGLIVALDSLFVKVDKTTYNFGTRSCEHIANELFPVLAKKYAVVHSVAVFEDDFNGATVVLDGDPKDQYKMRFRHGGIVPGVNDVKEM